MMAEVPIHALYESPMLQSVIGPALRPGGVELTRRALSFCDLPAGSTVADIGCGIGETVRLLKQQGRFKAIGLDRSSAMLCQFRLKVPGVSLIQGCATRLPFQNSCLSAVVCECMLSLVAEPDRACQEFYRVLAPGGYLILSDLYVRAPDNVGLLKSISATCCLKGARSRREVIDRLRRNGFSLVAWEDRSEDLKHLAARLAFAGISLKTLWRDSDTGVGVPDRHSALQCLKPGYFISVARRRGG